MKPIVRTSIELTTFSGGLPKKEAESRGAVAPRPTSTVLGRTWTHLAGACTYIPAAISNIFIRIRALFNRQAEQPIGPQNRESPFQQVSPSQPDLSASSKEINPSKEPDSLLQFSYIENYSGEQGMEVPKPIEKTEKPRSPVKPKDPMPLVLSRLLPFIKDAELSTVPKEGTTLTFAKGQEVVLPEGGLLAEATFKTQNQLTYRATGNQVHFGSKHPFMATLHVTDPVRFAKNDMLARLAPHYTKEVEEYILGSQQSREIYEKLDVTPEEIDDYLALIEKTQTFATYERVKKALGENAKLIDELMSMSKEAAFKKETNKDMQSYLRFINLQKKLKNAKKLTNDEAKFHHSFLTNLGNTRQEQAKTLKRLSAAYWRTPLSRLAQLPVDSLDYVTYCNVKKQSAKGNIKITLDEESFLKDTFAKMGSSAGEFLRYHRRMTYLKKTYGVAIEKYKTEKARYDEHIKGLKRLENDTSFPLHARLTAISRLPNGNVQLSFESLTYKNQGTMASIIAHVASTTPEQRSQVFNDYTAGRFTLTLTPEECIENFKGIA